MIEQSYPLPAGYALTVTVVDGKSHVRQVENAAIAALVTNAAPQVFGPYAIPHNFIVQDTGNVSVAIAVADFAADVPSAAQAALLDAIPSADQEDGATVWNDDGTLKVSTDGILP